MFVTNNVTHKFTPMTTFIFTTGLQIQENYDLETTISLIQWWDGRDAVKWNSEMFICVVSVSGQLLWLQINMFSANDFFLFENWAIISSSYL